MSLRRLLLCLLIGLPLMAACVPAQPTVLVYGDSLTVQSETAARHLYPKEDLVFRAWAGTAMCDYAPGAAADRLVYKPTRVVLAFTGNSLSPCAKAALAKGGVVGEVALYEQSLRQMRASFPTAMTVVIPPAMHDVTGVFPFNGSPALVAMYKTVGAQLHMAIDTAADDALTPGHIFRWNAPRFLNGPMVLVRTPDGIHLTPDGQAWYGYALGV